MKDDDLTVRGEWIEKRKMQQQAGRYAEERGDPPNCPCRNAPCLTFNGHELVMMVNNRTRYCFPAVSGTPSDKGQFDYSVARQRTENAGPIPEGRYWIRPDQMQETAWYRLTKPTSAWGNYWITIHPYQLTETYGRGGFFIHRHMEREKPGRLAAAQ